MSELLERTKQGHIKIRQWNKSGLMISIILLLLIAVALYGFITIDTKGADLGSAGLKTLEYFGNMFGSPRAKATHFGLKSDAEFLQVLLASGSMVLTTLALAFMTTLIGGFFALILGLLAARNLTNKRISNALKGLIAVIRAVPTVLWVLIFAIGAGLGSVAAIIGMSFHTVGYLLKAYSESFEELDEGTIEALRAAGASWLSIIFQAVLPSSITSILSWTFIRFEINFAVAVAMGAAAGAGGIGFNLFMSAGYFFDMREIGFITYWILAVALMMEWLATKLKEKYQVQ